MTIGDSLTHGFQSGAIYNTQISYPRIIAWEMGWSETVPLSPLRRSGRTADQHRVLDPAPREPVRRQDRLVGSSGRARSRSVRAWTRSRTTGSAAPAPLPRKAARHQPQPRHLRLGPPRRALADVGILRRRSRRPRTTGSIRLVRGPQRPRRPARAPAASRTPRACPRSVRRKTWGRTAASRR